VIGKRVSQAPAVLRQVVDAGHRIGNHSFAHDRDSDPMTDLARCQDVIKAVTGVAPDLYRPPEGRLTAGRLRAAWPRGLRPAHWSRERSDWALAAEDAARACGEWLRRRARPGDVILLHDDNPFILTVLDILLPDLARRRIDLTRAIGLV